MACKRHWPFVVLTVGFAGCSRKPPEPAPPSPDQKWYRVEYFQVHTGITGDPPPKLMSSEEAVRFFQEQFPAKRGQRHARNPREDRDWEVSRLIPEARLTGFCQTHVRIEIVKGLPREDPWRGNPRERTGCYVIPRSADIDALFDLPSAVATFTYTYKGIGQGSSVFSPGVFSRHGKPDFNDDVSRTLGKPDKGNFYQLMKLHAYYFAKDDVNIFCEYNWVYYIEKGKPNWLVVREQEQVRKNEELCNEATGSGE